MQELYKYVVIFGIVILLIVINTDLKLNVSFNIPEKHRTKGTYHQPNHNSNSNSNSHSNSNSNSHSNSNSNSHSNSNYNSNSNSNSNSSNGNYKKRKNVLLDNRNYSRFYWNDDFKPNN